MNRVVLFIVLFFAAVNGCKNTKSPLLPNMGGKSGEVLLVMDKKYWQADPGEKIREIFMKPFAVLPQLEPAFDLVYIPPKAFSNTFKITRNIIVVKVNSEYKTSRLEIRRNQWAKSQLMIDVTVPRSDSISSFFDRRGEELFNLIENVERKRMQQSFKQSQDMKINSALVEKYGISMVVPNNYTLDVDSNNFMWISNEEPEISQGIFVYDYDYTSPNTFTKEYLVKKRNEILKKYVPGPVRESYMSTEEDYVITFDEYAFRKDRYVAVMRGLWNVQNAFMGGPFFSVSTLNERTNRIVTMEGYVYAPQKDKRHLIRQLEAIIFSFEVKNRKTK